MVKKFLKGFIFIAIIGFFGSCDDLFIAKVTVEFDYTKFNTERTLWNSNCSSNYQYNLEYWNNGFSSPINSLIFVENDVYKNQIPQEDYRESYFYLTITDIYNRINELYLRYNNTTQNGNENYLKKIIIKYDEVNHIPMEIEEYYHVPENFVDAPSYCKTKITQYKIN
jgi:hypothetical protein